MRRFQINLPNGKQAGFTLIELLTVIVILAILATLTLAIQRISVESSRRNRTRSTILKIDTVLTSLYEKYQYQKVEIPALDPNNVNDVQLVTNITGYAAANQTDEIRGQVRQMIRTSILRDRLRLDFPVNLAEVDASPRFVDGRPFESFSGITVAYRERERSALSRSYLDVRREDMSNADLLYLIVMNGDPEMRSAFHDRELGDTNQNGLMEFIDGWGNPISFLRWAPSLNGSNRQPNLTDGLAIQNANVCLTGFGNASAAGQWLLDKEYIFPDSDGMSTSYADKINSSAELTDLRQRFADPFDRLELGDGWLLVPIVFSCGPDGGAGIAFPDYVCLDPFVTDSLGNDATLLGEADLTGEAADNITSHNYYNQ